MEVSNWNPIPNHHPTPNPTPNQVEVSNWINEFDQRNVVDSVTRAKVRSLVITP